MEVKNHKTVHERRVKKFLNSPTFDRYMGTENGVFKVFPGTLVPDILYDPREDRWYMAAVGQSKKYVFIGHPNQNASLITLARVFHQTRYSPTCIIHCRSYIGINHKQFDPLL